VVRAVGEVNELRFVLCPRYMTDQRFWAVYFALVQRQLPEAAARWAPGDALPPVSGDADAGRDEDFMSLAGLGSQLRTLSTKLQAAAAQSGASPPLLPPPLVVASSASTCSPALLTSPPARCAGGPAGLELTSFLSGAMARASPGAEGGAPPGDAAAPRPGAGGDAGGAMLQSDPDLEAYLQVGAAGGDSSGGSEGGGDGGSDDGPSGEELDLDEYLNELSAEVGDGEGGEGGGSGGDGDDDAVDVDAALRELAAEEEESAAAAAAAEGAAAEGAAPSST
jgi:hypothetical protein